MSAAVVEQQLGLYQLGGDFATARAFYGSDQPLKAVSFLAAAFSKQAEEFTEADGSGKRAMNQALVAIEEAMTAYIANFASDETGEKFKTHLQRSGGDVYAALKQVLAPAYLEEAKKLYNNMQDDKVKPSDVYENIYEFLNIAGKAHTPDPQTHQQIESIVLEKTMDNISHLITADQEAMIHGAISTLMQPLRRTEPMKNGRFVLSERQHQR